MTTTIASDHFFYTDTEGQGVSGPVYIIDYNWSGDQASGKDIAAADDFLFTDQQDVRINGKRAIADGDDLSKGPYNPGLYSEYGFKAKTMDGGVLYVTFYRA